MSELGTVESGRYSLPGLHLFNEFATPLRQVDSTQVLFFSVQILEKKNYILNKATINHTVSDIVLN